MERDRVVVSKANAVSALPVNEGERSEPERPEEDTTSFREPLSRSFLPASLNLSYRRLRACESRTSR